MDLFSRYVVSWEISTTLEPAFCREALKAALGKGRPEYFNTDQGAQFRSKEFMSILKEEKIRISMDGKSRVIDNIFIERFWRTLKYEEVYTKCYESVADCKRSLGEYIERYNRERLHRSLKEYGLYFQANILINSRILGGLLGSRAHVLAICGGLLEKSSLKKGAFPPAAVGVAFFNFIFYWRVIASATLQKQCSYESLKDGAV